MASSSKHNPEQASEAEPTVEMVKNWNSSKLLKWIQKYRPNLIEEGILKQFQNQYISGDVLVDHADNEEFFTKICNLPGGTSSKLAKLAREIVGKETTGMKSKYYLSYHTHHVDS
jgi:hypothetical protein